MQHSKRLEDHLSQISIGPHGIKAPFVFSNEEIARMNKFKSILHPDLYTAKRWWEQRSGIHAGGHFNMDQYQRYLEATLNR